MKLYHWTALVWLADIFRDGINRGEVPIREDSRLSFPNLTGSSNPHGQEWTQGGIADKTRVRLSVEISNGDPLLKAWPKVLQEYKVPKQWAKWLNDKGGGQAKFWYIYFGTIPPEWIKTVEVREGSTFQTKEGETLQALLKSIDDEREKLELVKDGHLTYVGLKDGVTSCWLLDGPEMLSGLARPASNLNDE